MLAPRLPGTVLITGSTSILTSLFFMDTSTVLTMMLSQGLGTVLGRTFRYISFVEVNIRVSIVFNWQGN